MKVKCIDKLRDSSNKLYGYTIIDERGKIKTVKKDVLKNAILNGELVCTNLQFTKDGRLIDKFEKRVYYKYTLWKNSNCVGNLFSGIKEVLNLIEDIAKDGDLFSVEAYSDVNTELNKIASLLYGNKMVNTNTIVFLSDDMRSRVIGNIDRINNIIKDYGYIIKESKTQRNVY